MGLDQAIKGAWLAVEESGVPDHVQELAFKEVLRAVLGTAKPVAANAAGDASRDTPRLSGDSENGSGDVEQEGASGEQSVRTAVADHTGVPVEKLEQVFHLDNGVVKIAVNHNALGRNAADKTRAAAQIITVVRKIGMGEADTDFDVIRDECQRKHFYDGSNFANKHLPGIDGFVIKGDGRKKRLEARTAGISAFPALIDRVLGSA
jgi:hypothetical protein